MIEYDWLTFIVVFDSAYAKNVAEEIKNCANLTVEIRRLTNADDIMDDVLDAMRRNILFVVVINETNQKFDSVTLFVLHGSPEGIFLL